MLDALISLAEMTAAHARVSFGEWAEVNPELMPSLRAAEVRMREAERKMRKEGGRG